MPATIPAPKDVLPPVPKDTLRSTYLAALLPEQPFAASQFGLALTTALEIHESGSDLSRLRSKDPTDLSTSPTTEPPHFRSIALPVQGCPGEVTVVEVTLSGHACTFYAPCEKLIMKAVMDMAVADKVEGATGTSDDASAVNMRRLLAKEALDPLIRGHYENVKTVIAEILDRRSKDPEHQDENDPELFYSLNDIWVPALGEFGELSGDANRGMKFVMTEEKLLGMRESIEKECRLLEETQGLVLGDMVKEEIPIMLKANSVDYSEHYGLHLIKRSKCFRTRDGQMVAWAGSHEDCNDFAVAALHVLPEYRKLGLGRLVLLNLALLHVQLTRQILTLDPANNADAIPTSALYAHADCLDYNLPTMIFMERCGFHRVGVYNWMGVLPQAKLQKRQQKQQAAAAGAVVDA